MRNHWLKLHRLREAKRNCEVHLFSGMKTQDIVAILPFADHIAFKPDELTSVSGFIIMHKGKDVMYHYFAHTFVMKKGEVLNLDLSKITFRV
jgi:hypothetical protein